MIGHCPGGQSYHVRNDRILSLATTCLYPKDRVGDPFVLKLEVTFIVILVPPTAAPRSVILDPGNLELPL